MTSTHNNDLPKSSNPLYLSALSVLGAVILFPLTYIQPFLSQGDHGLNLYAAQAVARGEIPYHDFFWVYGPLMPYIYGAALKIFGNGIQTLLITKTLLIFLSGLLIYKNLSLFIPRAVAAAGCLWFWIFFQDFPYTFNHIGGVPCLLFLSLITSRYILYQRRIDIALGLVTIVLLSLIKFNFGIALLPPFLLMTMITDKISKKFSLRIYFLSAALTLSAIGAIYLLFLQGLPFDYIRQCFPYFGSYVSLKSLSSPEQQTYIFLNILVNGYEVIRKICSSWAHFGLGMMILGAAVICARHSASGNTSRNEQRSFFLLITAQSFFYVFALHEFLILNVFYQAYWAEGFKVLLLFSVLGCAFGTLKLHLRMIWGLLFLILLLPQILTESRILAALRMPQENFQDGKSLISIGNDPEWIQTIHGTTNFLKMRLGKDELFWAAPYDPLYYYLMNKPSPTKELMILNLPFSPEQEDALIQTLDTKNVNWIVFSNRGHEPQTRSIGPIYYPRIAQYIEDNFVVAAQFGDWDAQPFWWSGHATRVLKRKNHYFSQ